MNIIAIWFLQHFHRYKKSQITVRYGSFGIRERLQCLEIVKICYNSIVSNIHDRPVHLLTKDNIAHTLHFLIIFMIDWIEENFHTPTFPDILRICLLFDKGGIWMDSTLLITDSISIPAPDYFHSIKIVTGSNTTISAYRWATFFLASTHGNPAFGTIQSIFLKYLQEYNKMIDYLPIN